MTRIVRIRHPRGVGIVEALVSLLVLALGMMSIAGMQARLRLNSDVAKQRSEAVRIAQEDIENFRSFGTFAVDGTITNNFAYNSISAGSASRTVLSTVTTKTNATFTVTRLVADAPRAAGVSDAPVKNVAVTVAWTDRNGGVQGVTLRSVVSRSDPAVAASLALAPNGSPVRDLLGRDIQVPIPAKNLGDGTSAIKNLSAGSVAFVFNNDTGVVTKRCTGVSVVTNLLTTTALAAPGVVCTAVNAYLISGFVRTSLGNPSATNPNDAAPGGVSMRVDLDNTAPPVGFSGSFAQLTAAYWPAIANATGQTIGTGSTTYTPAECNAEPLQTIRYTTPVNYSQVNNGNTQTVISTTVIAIIPQSVPLLTPLNIAPWVGISAGDAATKIVSPSATGERYVGFACLVYPIDLDINPSTAGAYTARLSVWPTSGWSLGNANGTYKVCRYSADYNLSGGVRVRTNASGVVDETSGAYIKSIDNAEHTYAYLNAQRSLSNQNFLIIDGQRGCPTDAPIEVDGQGGENYTDESTVTHQP
jgi:Tfp pilus assembly protein PilV